MRDIKRLIQSDLTLKQYCNVIELINATLETEYNEETEYIIRKIYDLTEAEISSLYEMPIKEINKFNENIIKIIHTIKETKYNAIEKIVINNKTYYLQKEESEITIGQFILLSNLMNNILKEAEQLIYEPEERDFVITEYFVQNNYKILVEALAILLDIDIEIAGMCKAKEGVQATNFFLNNIIRSKLWKARLYRATTQPTK